ncbi:MAG TPA: VanZ family protein [Gammaproteobacteria bacterium]
MSAGLRYHAAWRRLGLLLIAADVYLSLSPGAGSVSVLPDKIAHFLVYAVLAFWFATLYPHAIGWIFAGLLALGGTLEILQGLGEARHAEWLDFGANLAGCLAGGGLVLLLPFNTFHWIETKLRPAAP